MRTASFQPPKQASASHLIHLVGIDHFRNELAKQQKAKAEGLLEVITATAIKRSKPISKREKEMMDVAYTMHLDGKINDLTWSQIRAIFVYMGANKDKDGYITAESFLYPHQWEPAVDLAFAKRLLPKFLHYQLQQYKELGASIDSILDQINSQTQKKSKKAEKRPKRSSDQLRRAEEVSHWNKIKNSSNKRELLAFIRMYKGGMYERIALLKLEELAWSELGPKPSSQSVHNFLKNFPYGRHSDEAKQLLEQATSAAASGTTQAVQHPVARESALAILTPSLFFKKRAKKESRELAEPELYKTPPPPPPRQRESAKTLLKSLAAGILLSLLSIGLLLIPNLQYGGRDGSIRTFTGHKDALKAAVFLPNGKFALSASADRTIKLWHLSTGKAIRTFRGHGDIVSSIAISSNGRTAISGSYDGTLKHWNLRTGELLGTFEGHQSGIASVAMSQDGLMALSGSHDHTVKLWDVINGELIKTFKGHTGWVTAVSFINKNNINAIISSSHDKTLRLWDINTGKTVHIFVGHKGQITSLSTSNHDLTALSGSDDKTIRLWNVQTGEEIRNFSNLKTEAVQSVNFAPNKKYAITSTLDRKLILWDINNGQEVQTLYGHKKADTSFVTISPDGKYALSAGEDSTLKLWRLNPLQRDKNTPTS